MFLYIYVDDLALYKPGIIDDILIGVVHEFDTGPTFGPPTRSTSTYPKVGWTGSSVGTVLAGSPRSACCS